MNLEKLSNLLKESYYFLNALMLEYAKNMVMSLIYTTLVRLHMT